MSDAEPACLTTRLFDTILEDGDRDGAGVTFNLDEALASLLSLTAYLAAMCPDLVTRRQVREWADKVRTDLIHDIASARADQQESGLDAAITTTRAGGMH